MRRLIHAFAYYIISQLLILPIIARHTFKSRESFPRVLRCVSSLVALPPMFNQLHPKGGFLGYCGSNACNSAAFRSYHVLFACVDAKGSLACGILVTWSIDSQCTSLHWFYQSFVTPTLLHSLHLNYRLYQLFKNWYIRQLLKKPSPSFIL